MTCAGSLPGKLPKPELRISKLQLRILLLLARQLTARIKRRLPFRVSRHEPDDIMKANTEAAAVLASNNMTPGAPHDRDRFLPEY